MFLMFLLFQNNNQMIFYLHIHIYDTKYIMKTFIIQNKYSWKIDWIFKYRADLV